jgi:hypothetical protein
MHLGPHTSLSTASSACLSDNRFVTEEWTGGDRIPRDPGDDYTVEAAEQRREFLRERTGAELVDVGSFSIDPAVLPVRPMSGAWGRSTPRRPGSPALAAVLVLMLTLAAIAVVANSAVASAGTRTITYVFFKTEGEHGHELAFYGRGSANAQRGAVSLEKGRNWYEWTTGADGHLINAKTSKGSTATQYTLKTVRRLSARRIEVPMGTLGSFSARFKPESVERAQGSCFSVAAYRGRLVGRLRFDGENGYAAVNRRTAKARVAVVHRSCRKSGSARAVGGALRPAGSYQPPTLTACGPDPGTLLAVSRTRYFADFTAWKFERTPTARILRYASAPRLADDFTFRRDLRSAKLRPERPIFNGSASYRNQLLSGDLTARFQGIGAVPLAPGDASLISGEPTEFPDCPGFPGALGRWGRIAAAGGGAGPAVRAWPSPLRPAPSRIAPAP